MKKRMISALLTLCLLLSLATVSASASPVSGTCGKNLTWSFSNGTLTISGTGAMYDYAAEGETPRPAPWQSFAGEITNLVIGKDVTYIGSQAFRGTALADVDLSGTNVTQIGYEAFGLSDVTSVVLPHGLTDIPSGLFLNCFQLERVVIPDGVTSIGAEAFMLCPKLDFLSIPASVAKIGGTAFRNGPNEFRFEGDVPQMVTGSMGSLANSEPCTVYYPKGNETWNDEVFDAKWGAQIRWVGYDFTDVPFDAWFKEAVDWANDRNITAGTSATTFSPDADCTRAQVVTFLWRAAGEPAPTSTVNPFTDVKPDDYYYNAVLWAVEKDITVGTSDTTFSPNDTCTRAQVATFLWRTAGEPAHSDVDNPFTDVPADGYYYDPVLWAVENEITVGTAEGVFSPDGKCTRAQIVTFLYRFME